MAHLLDSVELPTGTLVECFYLGSYSTTREEYHWQMTNPDADSKSLHTGKEHRVKLLIDPKKIGVNDCNTGKRLHSFDYQDISNINIHHKYPNRLIFIVTHDKIMDKKMHHHEFKFGIKEVASKIAFILNILEKVKKFRSLQNKDTATAGILLTQLIKELIKFGAVENKIKPTVDIRALSYIESKIMEDQPWIQSDSDDMIMRDMIHTYRDSKKEAQSRKQSTDDVTNTNRACTVL